MADELTTTRRPNVALRDDELERIVQRLGREPTIVELHAFDAQWSEHCSYKSSRHHLRKLPTTGPDVILGPGEDAGVLRLGEHDGESWAVVVAHESHNHPSQVVPFEGAATGVGGIVRDVLCMGAQVIGVADPLRLGRIEDPHSHQRSVALGVVDGIGAYANAIGVPTIAGDVYFDERFDENCLVNVVALGVVKEAEIVHSYAPAGAAGWDVVLVGKATDPSGFGGASFSSLTLDTQDEEANKGAVQVPDPFLKNVLMRASYRVFEMLRERGVTAGFKDLGAGGVMGCSAELASSGGYGADLNLDEVNVAVDGMPPEVIAVGETQERLLWVLPPDVTPAVLAIYNDTFTLPAVARNARATVVGRLTKEKRYVLRHRGNVVMDVDIDFLTGSIADAQPFEDVPSPEPREELAAAMPAAGDAADWLVRVLAHRDVCSREPLYRRYDAVVRGMTVVARGAGEAGVFAAVPGSRLGVALGVAGNPRYGACDPRRAAELAVVEAACKVAATGARPIGLTDCLNFGNPRKIDQYSAFVAAVDGLGRAARELDLAFVSGNVSLYNESASGHAVPASAIVACIGAFADLALVVTPGFKEAGSTLFVAGNARAPIGATVFGELRGEAGGRIPPVDYAGLKAVLALLQRATQAGLVRSCTPIGAGGTLATIARALFAAHDAGRSLGAEIGGDVAFDETPGFVLEISDEARFLAMAGETAVRRAGVISAAANLTYGGRTWPVADLCAAWSAPLAEVYV